jgi:hypothetical protein
MVWTLHQQQQQCGAQLHNKAGQPGDVPKEAVEGRAAQDHEQAGETLPPGDYPTSRVEDRNGDITPTAPDPDVDWDEVVQPERQVGEASHDLDDQPLPEGK